MARRPTDPRSHAEEAPEPTRSRRARRPSLDDDIGARTEANRAAFAAIRTLRIIRGYLVAYAAICGIALLFLFLSGAGPIAFSVTLFLLVVSVAGALLVVQQPLIWTLANAVLATPVVAFMAYLYFIGGVSITGLLIMGTGVAFWFAVPVAARLQQLMREHPDLWAFRRTQGGDVGKHAAKWRVEAQRARRRVLIGLGVSVLAIVGLGWWVSQRKPTVFEERPLPTPTRPFDQAEMTWRSAWNGSRVDEVKGFLASSERAKQEPFFDRQRKKRSWDKLPNLQAPTITDHGRNQRSAEYVLDDLDRPIKVYWEWEPERWVVVNWSFPNR